MNRGHGSASPIAAERNEEPRREDASRSGRGAGRRHAARSALRIGSGRTIGGLVAALVVALGIVAMTRPLGARAQAGSQTTGNDVAQGAALFLQTCAACHGAQGQGTSNGPAIADRGAADIDFVLRTGRMPLAYPTQPMVRKTPVYDDAQIRAIVAYVASLGQGGPAIPGVTTTGADLAHGRQLFIENCAACHAATGAGDAVGGGFIAPALNQADPTTVGEAMRVGPGAMPVFDPKLFSASDVNDIAAYVQYMQQTSSPGGLSLSGVGPVSEGFVAAVVGLGLLLAIMRFIGRRRNAREIGTTQEERAEPGTAGHAGGLPLGSDEGGS